MLRQTREEIRSNSTTYLFDGLAYDIPDGVHLFPLHVAVAMLEMHPECEHVSKHHTASVLIRAHERVGIAVILLFRVSTHADVSEVSSVDEVVRTRSVGCGFVQIGDRESRIEAVAHARLKMMNHQRMTDEVRPTPGRAAMTRIGQGIGGWAGTGWEAVGCWWNRSVVGAYKELISTLFPRQP